MADRERGYAHRVDVLADTKAVWLALTDPTQLPRWCSPGAAITPRQGGLFRASVDRVTEFEAQIDVFEPERRLRTSWQQAMNRLKVFVEKQARTGAPP